MVPKDPLKNNITMMSVVFFLMCVCVSIEMNILHIPSLVVVVIVVIIIIIIITGKSMQ
jgi:hypothetical protein